VIDQSGSGGFAVSACNSNDLKIGGRMTINPGGEIGFGEMIEIIHQFLGKIWPEKMDKPAKGMFHRD